MTSSASLPNSCSSPVCERTYLVVSLRDLVVPKRLTTHDHGGGKAPSKFSGARFREVPAPGEVNFPTSFSSFGFAIACDDFNDDGFDDLQAVWSNGVTTERVLFTGGPDGLSPTRCTRLP